MNNLESYIEHTLLKPDASLNDIKVLIDEAVTHKFCGICINPLYVGIAREYLEKNPLKVVTVIGFPLGANLSSVKAFEVQKALEYGADELDMVIDIGAIKDKNYKRAENDIKAVVNAAEGKFVKVILETDLLSRDEIIEACKVSINAGAQFVKTSTGFVKGGVGATVENIKLMYEIVSPHDMQVKASGGVKDKETAIKMIKAGATRIGTSSGVKIVK
ncbi:MAG: deoxyribose-phosphate aldolase [Candidatus Gastranaerophilales bacterium]|nr:deoxyribose-phosphate aldolase [Candidatus Gastranaerophilales bacterium]